MSREDCLKKIKQLPLLPGVYIMKDKTGKIIYVGKAKKLYNRVGQYFVGQHTPKVQRMADQISDFDYIVAPSETEALILENNLIKLHRPKYNILLKDDKSYPYLAMEMSPEYPRLVLCRKREKDGKVYFGPFASGSTVREIKKQTEQLFGLVTCIPRKGTRACLSADIGHCSAPCEGKISKEAYAEKVQEALAFLKGDYKNVLRSMKAEMLAAAERLEFERAAALRDRIAGIEKLGQGQIMVLSPDMDEDVFGLAELEEKQCVCVLQVRDGRLLRQDKFFFDTPESGVSAFVQQYYEDLADIPPRIVCGEEIEESLTNWLSDKRGTKVRALNPKRGEQLELLRLAEKNASEGLELKRSLKEKAGRQSVSLAQFLSLSAPVRRIEMYDISNFGEDAMVGGMIVWEKGGLKKQQYRHFIIKEQYGIDDYAATRQMLSRRLNDYKEAKPGFEKAPDVIVMDGGKGHISAVADLVHTALPDCLLLGSVKDGRHRTRALISEDGQERGLAGSPVWFKFFTELQDEVHRYTVSFMHRRKSKAMTASPLLSVKGLGRERIKVLYAHFKTLEAMKTASPEALAALPKMTRGAASALYEFLHGGDQ